MIESATKVRRNPSVVARDLAEGGGAVLLHLASGQYHELNPVGRAVWDLLEQERTVANVVEALRERVEDPPPQLETDVLAFLRGGHERDLILVD